MRRAQPVDLQTVVNRRRTGSRALRRGLPRTSADRPGQRRGAGSLDYVLVLGVIIPLIAIVMTLGRRIIQLVYEMTVVLVSWPFL